jgi:hypothetical protein
MDDVLRRSLFRSSVDQYGDAVNDTASAIRNLLESPKAGTEKMICAHLQTLKLLIGIGREGKPFDGRVSIAELTLPGKVLARSSAKSAPRCSTH